MFNAHIFLSGAGNSLHSRHEIGTVGLFSPPSGATYDTVAPSMDGFGTMLSSIATWRTLAEWPFLWLARKFIC
jgi:hypothetical protein